MRRSLWARRLRSWAVRVALVFTLATLFVACGVKGPVRPPRPPPAAQTSTVAR